MNFRLLKENSIIENKFMLIFLLLIFNFFLLSSNVFGVDNVGNRYGIDTSHSSYSSQNPFCDTYCGQCTAFVWGRTLDRLGISIGFSQISGRNACGWANLVTNINNKLYNTPRKNSIAIWDGENNGCAISNPGHVAYVEEVEQNYVFINEANTYPTYENSDFGGGYNGYSKRLTLDEMDNRDGMGELLGYLYLDSNFSDYWYWNFDNQGTEDWNARKALNQGIALDNYWQIASSFEDNSSKRGIVSPQLSSVHTNNYNAIEVSFGINNRFLESVEAYYRIENVWYGPNVINWDSGSWQINGSQNTYRGKIDHTGQIQQVRIDFDYGSDPDIEDCRIYIDEIKFLKNENDLLATVTSINTASFPDITFSLQVLNEDGNSVKNLSNENFNIIENHPNNGNIKLEKSGIQVNPQANSNISVCLVMDCSGSMDGSPIADAKEGAIKFISSLKDNDLVSAIKFSNEDEIRILSDFSNDHGYLQNAISSSLYADGGTAFYDAVKLAVEQTAKEGSTDVKAVIAFTDGKDNDSVLYVDELLSDIKKFNVPVYTIGLGDVNEYDLQQIADETQGEYYNGFPENLETIYKEITKNIKNEYFLTYKSPNQDYYDGTTRTVSISVNNYEGSGSSDFEYDVHEPLEIEIPPSIEDLTKTPQEPDTPLTIRIKINMGENIRIRGNRFASAENLKIVKIFYRPSGTSIYKNQEMIQCQENEYKYSIPANEVQQPGIDYYITFSDGIQSISSPRQNPSGNPYSIPVIPNEPPFIIHTPVIESPLGETITVNAELIDTTSSIANATLFYKNHNNVLYNSTPMLPNGNQYSGIIPSNKITQEKIEYYIKATDDLGVASYDGYAYKPYIINIIKKPSQFLDIWTDNSVYSHGQNFYMGLAINNTMETDLSNVRFTLSLTTPLTQYEPIQLIDISDITLNSDFSYTENLFFPVELSDYLPEGDYCFTAIIFESVSTISESSFPLTIDNVCWTLETTDIEPLTLDKNEIEISIGYSEIIEITGGIPDYDFAASPTDIVDIEVEDNFITIIGKNPGSTSIVIEDASNPEQSITLEATVPEPDFDIQASVDIGESIEFEIGGGLAPYSILNNYHSNIAGVELIDDTVSVLGQEQGSIILVIIDANGKSVFVKISVM